MGGLYRLGYDALMPEVSDLAQALATFAIARSAALSATIEELGRAAVEGFRPPGARKNLEFHRAWQALARDPMARTWCLDSLLHKLPKLMDGEEHGAGDKCEAVVERLDVLTTLAPDPRIALVRDAGRVTARVLASRLGAAIPDLDKLPTTRVEIVGNRTLAKELRAAHPRLDIVDVSPPSGIITGVK